MGKQSYDEKEEEEVFRILVVGECGDGKSMLLKAFLKEFANGWPESLSSGVAAKGVSKEVVPYPFKIDGRKTIMFDTPGVGDSDIKIPHLVAAIEAVLQENACNAIIMCNMMGKNRIGLGAQIVTCLIKAGIVEANEAQGIRKINKSVIFVGTQMDAYIAGKSAEKAKKKIAKWDAEIPGDMNKRCGFKGLDTVRVAHTSINVEDEAKFDDEDMVIDISEVVKEIRDIMKSKTNRQLAYVAPDEGKLLDMFNKETGLSADKKKLQQMERELREARKELSKWKKLRQKVKVPAWTWSGLFNGLAGYAAGGASVTDPEADTSKQ